MTADRDYVECKRFYCPIGAEPTLHNGFLMDPENEIGECINPNILTIEKLLEFPCVVILGEQGIGKSTVLQQASQQTQPDTAVLHKDTGRIDNSTRLVDVIFGDPDFQKWAAGDGTLDLFLDSLDEGPLDVYTKATALAAEISKYPTDRLRLRIACRTADWPSDFQKILELKWDKEQVRVCGLAPLRWRDAEAAARDEGCDSKAFMDEIHEKSIGPLAAKPLSLRMLIQQFKNHGTLPASQTELMRAGLSCLCDEITRARQKHSNLSTGQRFAIASRIAAVTMLCKRPLVWTGADSIECPEDGCVPVDEISGGTEFTDDNDFNANEDGVRETLSTGLFRAAGNDCVAWGHQSYGEYLAAHYIHSKDLPIEQVKELLMHPSGPVVPQLRTVAGWLAAMDKDFLAHLLDYDPEALLYADLTAASDAEKASVAAALLRHFEKPGVSMRDRFSFRELNHPGLDEQIGPYVRDRSKSEDARAVALVIADDCRLTSLADDLVAVALDPQEPGYLRVRAVKAIGDCGTAEHKKKLILLARGVAEDSEDELKGAALRTMWPGAVTIHELLPMLARPKNSSLIGGYWGFCTLDLLNSLPASDLPAVLQWIETLPALHKYDHWFHRFVEGIIELARDHLSAPGVGEALAQALIARLGIDHTISVPDDDEERLQLLPKLIDAAMASGTDPRLLAYHGARPRDVVVLLGQLKDEPSEARQAFLATMIARLTRFDEPGMLDAIIEACDQNAALAAEFADFLTPVELDSARALEMQKYHEMVYGSDERNTEPEGSSVAEVLHGWIDKAETSDVMAWVQIVWVMQFEENGSPWRKETTPDITEMPGWNSADPQTRDRISAIAGDFVFQADPKVDEWLPQEWILNAREAYDGYRALHLLHKSRDGHILNLPDELWRKWAPAIVAGFDAHHSEVGAMLLGIAYANAKREAIATIVALLDHAPMSIVWSIEKFLDSDIEAAMLAKLMEGNLTPEVYREVLRVLLQNRNAEAIDHARSVLDLRCSTDPGDRDKAISAARNLLAYVPDQVWDVLWPAIEEDDEFGKQVIGYLIETERLRSAEIATRLTPDQSVDLYLWVEKHYPNEGYRHVSGAVGPDDERYWWKNGVINHLTKSGEVEALERLRDALPEITWLERCVVDARKARMELSWKPPTAAELMELTKDPRKRLIQSEEQLLDVVMESLVWINARLHGESPEVNSLWDNLGRKGWKPKDENHLSDHVARYLRDRLESSGVVLNREVEIRRKIADQKGQRTDILVQTTTKDRAGRSNVISIVIEVKGNWNPDLNTAMKDQLADRYLREYRCRSGIYLVGWFDSSDWRSTNNRRAQARRRTLEESSIFFEDQAISLCKTGTNVRAYVLDASR